MTHDLDPEALEEAARALYEAHPQYDLDAGFEVVSWERLIEIEADYCPTVTSVREKAHACVTAYLASMQGKGWRDISTAPKDGTWVLVGFPSAGGEQFIQSVARWRDDIDDPGFPAWFDGSVGNWGMEYYLALKPSHWQPLPPPPAGANP